MLSNVKHEDGWPMHVSSACIQSMREEDEANKLEGIQACDRAAHHDKSLTERDYIGLSAAALSASTSMTQNVSHNLMSSASSKCSDSREESSEGGDTELRLGIGPYNGDVSAPRTSQHGGHLTVSVPQQHLFSQNQILKQAEDGSNGHYRYHDGVSGSGAVAFHQSFWPWGPGVAPGRFMIPVPKISMVPAKRPFLEVMGENNSKASVCTLATNPNALSESAALERANHTCSSSASPSPIVASSGQGGSFFGWSSSNGMPPNVVRTAWQHGNCNQEGMVSALPTKHSCPTRALPPPPLFKPSSAPQAGQCDKLAPMKSNLPVAPHLPPLEERAALTLEGHKEDSSKNKTPVVGWPPVRSFRKNTLQSAAGLVGTSKGTGASLDVRNHEDTNKVNELAADQQMKGSVKDALFVKAKLDGVRICRKVDIASYSSYETLKSALQEMFQGFVCNENAKLDLLHGENYVLTHEDKDGDWMLVGDVPWRMFVATVKSLRIMKAGDAVGLGEKVFTKLKAQD